MLVVVALVVGVDFVSGLHAYGHAYSRPDDFTPDQFAEVARRFAVFTVEKAMAQNVYGNASAKPPFRTNSIAATVGTARKIKAINPAVKVLMYWNNALHYNMYECEAEVQPSWLEANPSKAAPLYYNYSVPEFREWWVRCAVEAITNSSGLLDGLFLDAGPKLEYENATEHWGGMVDEMRRRLPAGSILINNGFRLSAQGVEQAGEAQRAHTKLTYVESMAGIGSPPDTPTNGLHQLQWLANASAAHPDRLFYGHGAINPADPSDAKFVFGLAKYLLVTNSVSKGYFLGNTNYSIDGGLLEQPTSVYGGAGVGCGEPTAMMQSVGPPTSYTVRRQFEHGYIEVNLVAGTATIKCSGGAVDCMGGAGPCRVK